MSGKSDFDIVVSKLLEDSRKANIIYNHRLLSGDPDNQKRYEELIIEKYHKEFPDTSYLFYQPLYTDEIADLHERISYIKHDRVLRHGRKCKFCKGTNTESKEVQTGGGDEYIPSRVTCLDCGKVYKD